MPLVHFTRDQKDVPADAVNVRFSEKDNIWLCDSHVGCCLAERELNMRDDSDFYMTVWNDAEGRSEEVMFATTRGWSYPCLGSSVDATPERVALYQAEQARKEAEYRARLAAEEAKRPAKGRTVRVVRGRKVKPGTVGEVFWLGEPGRSRYSPFPVWAEQRVGLQLPDGTRVFTNAGNLEVVVEPPVDDRDRGDAWSGGFAENH